MGGLCSHSACCPYAFKYNVQWDWDGIELKSTYTGQLRFFSEIVVIFHAFSRLFLADYDDNVDCEITPLESTHYVEALYERYADAAGCVSNETTPSGGGQRVHVVHLLAADPGQDKVVTLTISPENPTGKTLMLHPMRHSCSTLCRKKCT